MDPIVIQVVEGAFVAAVYGGYAYLTKKIPDPEGTAFEAEKLGGTILIGAVVGGGMGYYGMTVSETAVVAAMTTIGAMEVVQKFVKPCVRWIRAKLGF